MEASQDAELALISHILYYCHLIEEPVDGAFESHQDIDLGKMVDYIRKRSHEATWKDSRKVLDSYGTAIEMSVFTLLDKKIVWILRERIK